MKIKKATQINGQLLSLNVDMFIKVNGGQATLECGDISHVLDVKPKAVLRALGHLNTDKEGIDLYARVREIMGVM